MPIFLCWSWILLSFEHWPTWILLRRSSKVWSLLCLITCVSLAFKYNDHILKNSQNVLLYPSNILGNLIGDNCSKSPETRINTLSVGGVSRQPNISHNLLCIWSKRIFETIDISSIRTTATSEYKLRSLGLSETEALTKYIHLHMVEC